MLKHITNFRYSLVSKLIVTVGITMLLGISIWAYFSIKYQREKIAENTVSGAELKIYGFTIKKVRLNFQTKLPKSMRGQTSRLRPVISATVPNRPPSIYPWMKGYGFSILKKVIVCSELLAPFIMSQAVQPTVMFTRRIKKSLGHSILLFPLRNLIRRYIILKKESLPLMYLFSF